MGRPQQTESVRGVTHISLLERHRQALTPQLHAAPLALRSPKHARRARRGGEVTRVDDDAPAPVFLPQVERESATPAGHVNDVALFLNGWQRKIVNDPLREERSASALGPRRCTPTPRHLATSLFSA